MTIAVSEVEYIDAAMVIQGPPSVAAAPAVVVATATVAPVVILASPTVAPVVIVPTPTSTPTPSLAEIETVGQWVTASEEQKRATTLLWSQRLASNGTITVDPRWYANELFDCVDITLGGSVEPFGAAYSIDDVAAVCIVTMGTP
jgi:hypothetical protein